jgi:hypothetical protein
MWNSEMVIPLAECRLFSIRAAISRVMNHLTTTDEACLLRSKKLPWPQWNKCQFFPKGLRYLSNDVESRWKVEFRQFSFAFPFPEVRLWGDWSQKLDRKRLAVVCQPLPISRACSTCGMAYMQHWRLCRREKACYWPAAARWTPETRSISTTMFMMFIMFTRDVDGQRQCGYHLSELIRYNILVGVFYLSFSPRMGKGIRLLWNT